MTRRETLPAVSCSGPAMHAAALTLALLCTSSCGCGGASPPSGSTRDRSGASDARRDGGRGVVEMFWQGGPELGFVARSDEGDGFVHRGTRLLMREGRSEIAEDVFAASIVAASREGGRWWFLASDGTLWRAPSFLARPERAGRVALGERASFTSAGSSQEGLLLVHPAPVGDLYRLIGGVPRRIDALPRGGVVGGAFLDARRGVALLDGGILARTDDGGATWSPVTIRDEAVGVHAVGDSYRVLFRGDTRRLRLSHDGTSTDLDRELAITDTMSALDALRALADLELPASSYAVGGLVTTPLAVVERLRTAAADPRIFLLPSGRLPTSGAAMPTVTGAAFFGPRLQSTLAGTFQALDWAGTTRECSRQAWGAGGAVWCPEHRGPTIDGAAADDDADESEAAFVLHRVDDRGDSEQTDVVLPTVAFRLLDDGLGVAWAGGCDRASAGERDPTRFCWVPDVRTPRPLPVTVPGRVADGSRDWLIVERPPEADGEPLPWTVEHHPPLPVERTLVRLERDRRGVARAVPRPMPAVPRGYAIESADLTIDATLVVVANATRAGAPPILLVGRPEGALERRTLPSGARRVAFLDARRGIAVGRNATQLHRTIDGARTWENVPLPIDGDASLLPLVGDGARVSAFCLPARCGVVALADRGLGAAHVSLRGWGALRASSERRVLVAERGPESPPPMPMPVRHCGEPRWFGRLQCEPAPNVEPTADMRGVGRRFLTGGWVDVAASGAPGRATARLRWSGLDESGAFSGAAGPFGVWGDTSAEGLGEIVPLAMSRRGVLLVERGDDRRQLRFAGVADRRAEAVFRASTAVGYVRVASLPAADGRFAVVRDREEGGPIDVTVFASDGSAERNRSFVLASVGVPPNAATNVGVAREGDRFFAVAPIGDSPAAWRVYALDRAELPRTYGVIGGPLPGVCRDERAGALVAVVPAAGVQIVAPGGGETRAAAVELELTPGRVCVRAIHWRGRLRADGSGRLVGDHVSGPTTTPTTCTLEGADRTRVTDCAG